MATSRLDVAALADELFSTGTLKSQPEAVLRAAVSRAYYAVYYLAAEVSAKCGAPKSDRKNAGSHDLLYDSLFLLADTLEPGRKAQLKSAASRALALKKRRRDADYNLGCTIDARFAASTRTDAADATRMLMKFLPPEPAKSA